MSHAAISTLLPNNILFAIFPSVVVFPLPLTPINKIILFEALSRSINFLCLFDKISSIFLAKFSKTALATSSCDPLTLFTDSINWLTTSKLISEEIKIDSNSSNVFESTFLLFRVFKIFRDKKLEDLPNLFLKFKKRFMLSLLIMYHHLYLYKYRKLFYLL